jgi:hypothetical protein
LFFVWPVLRDDDCRFAGRRYLGQRAQPGMSNDDIGLAERWPGILLPALR